MDRVFLDANVLFSAAYRSQSRLRRLWELPDVELCTSAYAAEEARRNLNTLEQHAALHELLDSVTMVRDVTSFDHPIFQTAPLAEKDRPILLAAAAAQATHLLTGDFQHFGPFFGQRVLGVLILPPADYLQAANNQ